MKNLISKYYLLMAAIEFYLWNIKLKLIAILIAFNRTNNKKKKATTVRVSNQNWTTIKTYIFAINSIDIIIIFKIDITFTLNLRKKKWNKKKEKQIKNDWNLEEERKECNIQLWYRSSNLECYLHGMVWPK